MLTRIARLGENTLYALEQAGAMGVFLCACLGRIITPPVRVFPIVKQVHFIGARSMFVIVVAGAFTGMVLALQGFHSLEQFGSTNLLGSLVALGLLRELGPVLTALLVIGRAGSAMCAEIGIMRISEQIDALECMAIDPYRYVMAPKYLACLLAVPILTSVFDVSGIAGGYLVAVHVFEVNEGSFFNSMYRGVVWDDVEMGVVKSFLFALLIVWISTAKGFYLHRDREGAHGAEGVSRVATNAVVMASLAILFADYILSAIMI